MQQQLLESLAAELYAARTGAAPVSQLTARYPDMTLEDAYAIQTLTGNLRLADGGRIVGYKIGLTSEAVQQQLGVNEPDFGLVFADMEVRKDQPVPLQRLIAPKAEGEIGFVFRHELNNPDITLTELKSAIDYFFPVVEIVDSAIADWKITLRDTVADNASSGMYVPGDTFHDPRGVDFAALNIRILGEGVDISGRGAACLGNPLYATLWLVRKMISLGRPVQAGQLVLSGAMAPMVTLQPGQPLVFDFAGLESIRIIAG